MSLFNNPNREPFRMPHIGQRITKTAIAVFLCLVVFYLRGIEGASLSSEACITAIICMQPSATPVNLPSTAWPAR